MFFIRLSITFAQNLKNESNKEKAKIKFIHLNHTNPLINSASNERKELENKGFSVGEFKELIHL